MNEYNKVIPDPIIREGNWVEERALKEFTGNHRRFDSNDPTMTAKRNIFHTNCPNEWSTQTGAVHNRTLHDPQLNGTIPVSTALPRVSSTKKAQYLEMAHQIVEDEYVAAAKQVEDDVNSSRFQAAAPQNRKRAMEPIGRVPRLNSLYEPAITKYSEDPLHTDRMTPLTSANPFAKSTSFSNAENRDS